MTRINAIDRLHTVADCLDAIDQLLIPENDLCAVSRDKFSILIGFLMDEHRAALAALIQSVNKPPTAD